MYFGGIPSHMVENEIFLRKNKISSGKKVIYQTKFLIFLDKVSNFLLVKMFSIFFYPETVGKFRWKKTIFALKEQVKKRSGNSRRECEKIDNENKHPRICAWEDNLLNILQPLLKHLCKTHTTQTDICCV